MVEVQFYDSPDELTRSGTPLRRFWGTVSGVEPKQEESRNVVQLQFTDIEIVPYPPDHTKFPGMAGVIAPYPYPVASLDIPYRLNPRSGQPSENSTWGILVSSLKPVNVPRARELVGRRVLMEAEPEHVFFEAREATETRPATEAGVGMVWRVVEVKGRQTSASNDGLSETEQFLRVLNGKTKSDFIRTVLQTDLGRKNQDSVISGELLQVLVASGRVTTEGDKYVVSGVPSS